VLEAFFLKVTVTPAGMFTVVKLKIPLDGNCSTVSAVGLKAPSAPVLPLLKAGTGLLIKSKSVTVKRYKAGFFI
jgi:hypothetical protein